jgi:site-specific recombinase XerD
MIASVHKSLADLFRSLYAPRHLLSAITVVKYEGTLRHFDRFLGCTSQPTDLEEDRIAEFLYWFSDGRQPWTVTTARKHLLALANYAHRKGIIAEAPDVARVKLYERLPEAYTIEEISHIVDAAGHMQGIFSGVPGCVFFPALFFDGIRHGRTGGRNLVARMGRLVLKQASLLG